MRLVFTTTGLRPCTVALNSKEKQYQQETTDGKAREENRD